MLEALITGMFEMAVYGVGRVAVRLITLGRFAPKESDKWWVQFVGLGVSIGIAAAVIYAINHL